MPTPALRVTRPSSGRHCYRGTAPPFGTLIAFKRASKPAHPNLHPRNNALRTGTRVRYAGHSLRAHAVNAGRALSPRRPRPARFPNPHVTASYTYVARAGAKQSHGPGVSARKEACARRSTAGPQLTALGASHGDVDVDMRTISAFDECGSGGNASRACPVSIEELARLDGHRCADGSRGRLGAGGGAGVP